LQPKFLGEPIASTNGDTRRFTYRVINNQTVLAVKDAEIVDEVLEEFSAEERIRLGIYRHSKSGEYYAVIDCLPLNGTSEVMVIYINLAITPVHSTRALCCRSIEEFTSVTETGVPRFSHI